MKVPQSIARGKVDAGGAWVVVDSAATMVLLAATQIRGGAGGWDMCQREGFVLR
jgi:hypothetical protein